MDRAEAIKFAECAQVMAKHSAPEVKEFYKLAETALREQEERQWISVKDRLPESGQCVLIFSETGGVAEGQYRERYHDWGQFSWMQFRWSAPKTDVTHWMPLPEPPKEE